MNADDYQTDMRHPSLATLAFLLFQLLTATLFLRPAELLSWLEGLPLYEGLIISTFLLAATSVQAHFQPFAMLRQPITYCAVGMLLAIVISHLQHIYVGGAYASADQFLRTLVYYGLTVTCVNTPGRLKNYMGNVAVCTSIMVTLCLFDYWQIFDFQFIEPLRDVDGYDDDGFPIFIYRIRGTGIFQDPNDLCMVIVAGGSLCLAFLFDRSLGIFRSLWAIPLVIFAAAIFETKSRGGFLAASAAVMVLLVYRFGSRFGMACAIAAACALPVVAGRSANIDLSDGSTGHQRVELWLEGFEALKSPDLLFGIGHGEYADMAGLVAHNSFVHAYVELGVFGGTLFFGCFFFAFLQLYRIGQMEEPLWHPDLIRFRPYITAVLVGWCTSMMSLSRCYIVPTFLVLGMAAAYLNLCWIHTNSLKPLIVWNRFQFMKLTTASACMFIGLYVFTRVFS